MLSNCKPKLGAMWHGFKYYHRSFTLELFLTRHFSSRSISRNYVRMHTRSRSQWIVNKRTQSNSSIKSLLSSSPTSSYKNICDKCGQCECECDNCDFVSGDEAIFLRKQLLNHDKQRLYNSSAKRDGLTEHKRIVSELIETMNQPLTVCVEGNIGSGKTTFLKYFKKYPEVCVIDEPIQKWRDCQGYNLLDLMYKDPQKWSLCFQSYVQLTMLDLHTKPTVQPIKMMERSIFSAQYCFVQHLRENGLMDDPQYAVLSEWFNFSMENLPIKVDLIVYLRTDPEIAYKRMGQRGRSEENSIQLEYLRSVHKHHENLLIHNQNMLPCPVLTLDANTELADMTPNYVLCEEKMFQKVALANC